jgi:predicted nucleic acid-binding Zn ribbon protein
MSAHVRFGHCTCGAAIPTDSAMCSRCAQGSLRLLHAMAVQTRRDQKSWDRRHEAGVCLYLLAIVVGVFVFPPTVQVGSVQAGLFAGGLVAAIGSLGWMISPKTRRPR